MDVTRKEFVSLASEVHDLRAQLRAWRTTANRDDMVELLLALGEFMSCFELVFDLDWEMTKMCVREDAGWLIDKEGTFLRPLVDDERNNWHNRGALLSAYRHMVACMKKCDVQVDFWTDE